MQPPKPLTCIYANAFLLLDMYLPLAHIFEVCLQKETKAVRLFVYAICSLSTANQCD
ncbi:hypothetical protein PPEP_a1715 [Pseudoalteromonas peptidolytica F12-50-A1]|uniref:Uncharacterized protein n=1 Tax=Pseudoalteromonas peptidolytica F12-50-A1 TaxID=1315280 RepID=A0A8I0T4S3_9GAMM|nr:hypothetical protein [Pseudoalteromonas peptidolytica F12-50-A1]